VRIEKGLGPQKIRELLNRADELWNQRVTANVELTGAAPSFGAASSDRRERG
jgi:hypothetical protein